MVDVDTLRLSPVWYNAVKTSDVDLFIHALIHVFRFWVILAKKLDIHLTLISFVFSLLIINDLSVSFVTHI